MDIKRTEPSRLFFVTGGGAGIAPEFPCGHDRPSLSFHLFSQHGDTTEDIALVIPACAAAQLVGAALAFITHNVSEEAADQFLEEMHAARDKATRRLDAYQADTEAARAACCEAGARTQGLEHTCSPDTSA
ncbi:hypothetical protein [Streptomyces hirsutus]|uniref:hypothetical protein n=1 Tax=Streptomyces hirsutus TaxID=35620 RepID=UPI00364BD2A0